MNWIRIRTHKDDPKVPEGKAALVMDNNGFVGTSNGYPLIGRPALFPESQARAIMACVTYVQMYHPTLDEMPHPEVFDEKTMKWINGTDSLDHRD